MPHAVQALVVTSAQARKPGTNPEADLRRYYMLAHGCHLIDTARYLAGDIVAVRARLSERAGIWCWFVDVEFASGALGHLDLPIAVRMDWHEGFQIYGQNGSIPIADRHGIELGIEPELANVVNSFDPANLFEAASIASQRGTVSAAVDLLADRIAMGHAKDRTASGAFTTGGNGMLDYPHYLSCLKRAGFDGPLVTHGPAATETGGVAEFLRRALGDVGIAVSP